MHRRWRAAWPKRGQFFEVPPAQVAAAPPAYVPAFVEPAGPRPRGPRLTRRGSFFAVPPLALPPPAAIEPTLRPRLRLGRRGQHFEPPWPVIAAAPPVWVPQPARARRPVSLRTRRGTFYGPRWEAPFAPTVYGVGSSFGVGGGRAKPRPTRRGQHAEPPWPQVSAAPSVWIPPLLRAVSRLAGRPYRRGSFHEPPWPQGFQPSATAGIAAVVRPRVRLAVTRRGQFFEPPWPQAAQPVEWVPPFRATTTPARRGLLLRRGRFQPGPATPYGIPAWLRARPRPAPSLRRRRRFCEPPWVQGPQTVWRPDPVCQTGTRPKWPSHRPRRGVVFVVPPPPITTPAPRWAESAAGGTGLVDDAAGGTGLVESAAGGTGSTEGGAGV